MNEFIIAQCLRLFLILVFLAVIITCVRGIWVWAINTHRQAVARRLPWVLIQALVLFGGAAVWLELPGVWAWIHDPLSIGRGWAAVALVGYFMLGGLFIAFINTDLRPKE